MKNKLKIALLITIAFVFSCKHNRNDTNDNIIGHIECEDIIKPSNLKPINWNGWNDAYTVGYTFYDNIEDACHDYDGDTILCYGHISKNLYLDHPSLEPEWIFLEGSENQQDGQSVRIMFNSDIMQNSIEKDSLIRLLNSSSYSDTCLVKGVLGLGVWSMPPCQYVYPVIGVCRLEDIYFK